MIDVSGDPDQTVVRALDRLRKHDRLVSGEPVVIVANVATSHGYVNAIQVRTME